MAYLPLLKLKLGMCNNSIRVRLQSMWDNIHIYTQEFQSLDFVFVDDEGTAMHGTVWRYRAREFRSQFQEGKVYIITNIKLNDAKRYRPVPRDLKIVLLPNTKIEEQREGLAAIPRFSFSFADWVTIKQREENYDLFSDVIGLLTGYGPIEYSGNTGMSRIRRELELLISPNKYIRVVLWGKIAETLDDEYLASIVDYMVAVFTTMVVKYFAKKRSLSSTCGTKVLLNLDIPESQHTKDSLCHTCKPRLKFLAPSNGAHLPIQEQMFLNRKRIVEIKDILLSGLEGGGVVVLTCIATIKDFVPGKSWCYVSCEACKSKMEFSNGTFICDCGNNQQNPISRFMVRVRVSDDEESTTVVLFNNEIEKLFSTSATSLLRAQKNDPTRIPERLLDLIGMTFIFQIKITDYNFHNIKEDFSVIKTFKPIQSLEREHKTKMINQRMKEKTSESPNSILNYVAFASPTDLKNSETGCPDAPVKKGSSLKSSITINREDEVVALKCRKTKIQTNEGVKLFDDDIDCCVDNNDADRTANAMLKDTFTDAGGEIKPAPVSDDERGDDWIDLFNAKLCDDVIRIIFDKAVHQEPESYLSIILACKNFRQLVHKPVLRRQRRCLSPLFQWFCTGANKGANSRSMTIPKRCMLNPAELRARIIHHVPAVHLKVPKFYVNQWCNMVGLNNLLGRQQFEELLLWINIARSRKIIICLTIPGYGQPNQLKAPVKVECNGSGPVPMSDEGTDGESTDDDEY